MFPLKQPIIWPDQSEFFLTSSTYLHLPLFHTDRRKQLVLNKINQIDKILNISIIDFSISVHHLHLKFYSPEGKLVTKLKTILHSGISREYKKKYGFKYEYFWGSSRTYFIKDENMSDKVTGYITGNLLKHREVSRLKDLEANHFSSYRLAIKRLGRSVAQELVRSVIFIKENKEGLVDVEGLKKVKQGKSSWAI